MSYIRFGFVGLSAAVASLTMTGPILNETNRRNFYEDDSHVVPVPGTVTPSSGTELQGLLGTNRLIDGISVRSPSQVEAFFKASRESLYSLYTSTAQYLDAGYTRYHETEIKVTSTVSDLHAKHEDLLPNGIYVLVGALLGNIFARQRGVFAKVTFPVVFGLASFKYFLPETFGRTIGFAWRLEKQHLPHIANTQAAAVEGTQSLVSLIAESTAEGQLKVQEGVKTLRSTIADVTGLNLDEEVSKK